MISRGKLLVDLATSAYKTNCLDKNPAVIVENKDEVGQKSVQEVFSDGSSKILDSGYQCNTIASTPVLPTSVHKTNCLDEIPIVIAENRDVLVQERAQEVFSQDNNNSSFKILDSGNHCNSIASNFHDPSCGATSFIELNSANVVIEFVDNILAESNNSDELIHPESTSEHSGVVSLTKKHTARKRKLITESIEARKLKKVNERKAWSTPRLRRQGM